MNTKSPLISHVEAIVEPLLVERQFELVDVVYQHEQGRWVLRVMVDKTGGVNLDDCATLSHVLGDALDESQLLDQRYSLEISSPGIERPLKKAADFERFKTQKADIKLFAPLDGRRHFNGILLGCADGLVAIQDQDEKKYLVPLDQISKAHLDPDLDI